MNSTSNIPEHTPKLLFDMKVSEMSHQVGACTLWWPLNNLEIYFFDYSPDGQCGISIYLHCTKEGYTYSGNVRWNQGSADIPTFERKEYIFGLALPMQCATVQAKNIMTITIEATPKNTLMKNTENELKIMKSNVTIVVWATHWNTWQAQRQLLASRSEHEDIEIPSIHTIMVSRPRADFGFLLNMLGLVGNAVEIGVQKAEFSEQFLSLWNGKMYHMVDPWKHYSDSNYVDHCNVGQAEQDQVFMEAKNRMSKYSHRINFIRLTSLEAVNEFDENSLDFAYLDGRHDYYNVMMDMMAWWPKVKKGGIMAGHDFDSENLIAAVLEFSRKMDLPVFRNGDAIPSWYFFKA